MNKARPLFWGEGAVVGEFRAVQMREGVNNLVWQEYANSATVIVVHVKQLVIFFLKNIARFTLRPLREKVTGGRMRGKKQV